MNQGVAAVLDQLIVELRDGLSRTDAINEGKMPGGDEFVTQMSTVSQAAQPYRSVGRSVVDLAMQLDVPVNANDLLELDRCLDAAIAHTVTQHVSAQNIGSDAAVNKLNDLTETAISAFEVLQTGTVGVIGRTGTLVLRSLTDIRALAAQTS
jgi:hypothetical protein